MPSRCLRLWINGPQSGLGSPARQRERFKILPQGQGLQDENPTGRTGQLWPGPTPELLLGAVWEGLGQPCPTRSHTRPSTARSAAIMAAAVPPSHRAWAEQDTGRAQGSAASLMANNSLHSDG